MRDREGREPGYDIGAPRPHQDVDRAAERVDGQTGDGAMQVLPVAAQRRSEARAREMARGVALGDGVGRAGQLAAHQLAHALLQVRKSVEAEPVGEAHDGRWIDVERRRHLVDGRERHRLRMLYDVFGDPPLRLRQPVVASPQFLDHVARAGGRRCGPPIAGFGLCRLRVALAHRHAALPLQSWHSC